jgi:5-formyltetrahydrofolate cyclo-ligase
LERNLETNKNISRKKVLAKRNLLLTDETEKMSQTIFERLIGMEEYELCGDILVYASFGSEVITDKIIDHALAMDKNVYLPRVNGNDMDFYMIASRDELEEGSWHIPEPKPDSCNLFNSNANALVIMPLVAFDRNGNRIGYGKGYYDRFLSKHLTGTKIGIAYSLQECKIESEETDIRMDFVVTEKEIIETV